jgi:hypothetical protein
MYVNEELQGSDVLTGADFDRGDEIRCELTPFDGEDQGEVRRSSTVTVSNTPPTVDSVTISPTDPLADDVVSATFGTAEDLDGDDIGYTYAWVVDGASVSTAATLSSTYFKHGDTIQLTVRPVDGYSHGTPVTSNVLTGGNNPPEVRSVTLTGGDLYTNDVVDATVDAFDFDGESLTLLYAWYANGSLVTGASDSSLEGADYFDKDDEIYVIVTPDDGTDTGTSGRSSTVTILNSPPTAPVVVIEPEDPADDDTLQCVIDTVSTDEDDDPISYTFKWYEDDVLSSKGTTTTYTNDTIDSSERFAGDAWSCEVIPNDGDEDGESGWAFAASGGPWSFSSCAKTGQNGPTQSQCDSSYGGTELEGSVTVTGGIQVWEVPSSGTYRIEAFGAQGDSAATGYAGGRGARIRGDVTLSKGDELTIIVGQAGTDNGCSGGGGGGTYVLDDSGDAIIVAGGGGGLHSSSRNDGCGGRTSEYAGTGSASSSSWGCGAKSTGLEGGGIVSASSWGSAGAGLSSNGAYEYTAANGGQSPANGATGGGTSSYTAHGGFGGGGAGNGGCGGGGGGGYSGGDGGHVAGGGGSYNSGSNPSATAGYNTGAGKVTIERL